MADFSSGVRLSAANIWLRVWPVAEARSLNAGNDQAAFSVRSSALARYPIIGSRTTSRTWSSSSPTKVWSISVT